MKLMSRKGNVPMRYIMGRVLVIMLRAAGALTVACTHVPCQHITQHITNLHFEPISLSKSCNITCEYDCFCYFALGLLFNCSPLQRRPDMPQGIQMSSTCLLNIWWWELVARNYETRALWDSTQDDMGVHNEHLLFIISRQKSRTKEHAIRCALSHAMHCKGECLLSTSIYDILQITALLQCTITITMHTPKASGTILTSDLDTCRARCAVVTWISGRMTVL